MSAASRDGQETKRAMARGTISYLESQALPINKSAIFRHFGLSRSQGYAALSTASNPPSKREDPEWEETRGRPNKISTLDLLKMERVLWDDLSAGLDLNWPSLARMAGIEASCNMRTLHRAMGTLNYRLCLRCRASNVQRRSREKRVEHARRMLEKLPQPADWRTVRFSGELHFGFGLDGRVRLLPKPGEGECMGCKMHTPKWLRDVKRMHVWVAAGHGFRSEPVFYDNDSGANSQGLLSMDDYKQKVLDGVVRGWLARSMDLNAFTLEEDAEAFAHGGASRSNAVLQWKQSNGLKWHFGCPESPDLNLLDSIWPAGKEWRLEKPLADWEGSTLRDAVRMIWHEVDGAKMDIWVDLMVERLNSVVAMEGRFAQW